MPKLLNNLIDFKGCHLNALLVVTAFLFIIMAFIISATEPPVSGYEISIYDAYPPYFWFFIIASSACGSCILIHQAFDKKRFGWWYAGFCAIVLSNSLLLGLPYLRNYAFFPAGDAQTHVGMMKDIITTGYVGNTNFYPIVHILGVSLDYILGLDLLKITTPLIVFWHIIHLIGTYILATIISSRHGQVMLITAFTSPLIFSSMYVLIHPSMLSIYAIPFLLYFYHRSNKFPSERVSILGLIIFVFLITFTHPVTSLFSILIIFTLSFLNICDEKVRSHEVFYVNVKTSAVTNYKIVIIMVMIWSIWYFAFGSIQRSILAIYEFFVYAARTPLFEAQMEVLKTSEITVSQTISIFIYNYGSIFLYLILSTIAIATILNGLIKKKYYQMDFYYSLLFIIAFIFSTFSLFAFTGEYSVVRISRFFLLFAPIVSGLAIYRLVNSYRWKQMSLDKSKRIKKMFIITIVMFIITVNSINTLNIYGSPRTVSSNLQVSKLEIYGYKWFSEHQESTIPVRVNLVDEYILRRFEDFNFGYATCPPAYKASATKQTASHFGYDKNESIIETFNFEDSYLLTSERSRVQPMILPENVRPKAHIYSQEDFAKLIADHSADRVYSNGELEVWRVYS